MSYPRFVFENGVDPSAPERLSSVREVAPNLYVGDFFAVRTLPSPPPSSVRRSPRADRVAHVKTFLSRDHRPGWNRVVDLYGGVDLYRVEAAPHEVLRMPFNDGDAFPEGCLERVRVYLHGAMAVGPCLIHCQAGLSRSPSAAAALLVCSGLSEAEAVRRVRIAEFGERYPRKETLASALRWAERRLAEAPLLRGSLFPLPEASCS